MQPEQATQWSLVTRRAVDHLRLCQHIDRHKFHPLAQYLVIPSFGDTRCVDIVQQGTQLQAYVTIWRSSVDVNAFATPVERLKHPDPFLPTYESNLLNTAEDQLRLIATKIANLNLNLAPITNSISLDGVSYELNSGCGNHGVRLRWHRELPAEWHDLAPIVMALDRYSTSL